jgi:uncharacterized repeat protein (TIGR01451 family)
VRRRCLYGAVLLLGASLLLMAGRSLGQRWDTPPRTVELDNMAIPLSPATSPGRTVIATSMPVTGDTPPTLGMPKIIQPASYRPGPPPPDPPPGVQRGGSLAENGLIREPSPSAPAPIPPVPSEGKMPSSGPVTGSLAPQTSALLSATGAQVSVDVVGPSQVPLGQPLTHEIVLRNTGSRAVAEVRVEEPLPPGVRVLRADPPGQTRDDRLTWDLGNLEGNSERRLKVEVQPADASELHLRPYVTFTTSTGLRTQIVRPSFGVEIRADHEKISRGGRITFSIRVSNRGSTPIYNIKLYDKVPPGFRNSQGAMVRAILGDLAPGSSRTIPLEATAVQAGQFTNEAFAQADGGVEARARVDVEVTEPTLTLRVDGPKQGSTQSDLDFHLEVANPGPATAVKIRLVQPLPQSFEVVAASTGGRFDAAQHALIWTPGDLAAGQRQIVMFKIKARAPGDWPLYTTVLAENVPETRAANVLRIQGSPALTLEVRAREDPLAVGEETVYEVHVFNKGDASCAAVQLTAWLPDEVTPLDTKGPTSGQIQQQQARFLPLGQLQPRADALYRIHVRGQRPGRGSVRVELTAEREHSVQNELSINVNGGP